METLLCVPYNVKQKGKPQVTLYFKALLLIFSRVMCSRFFSPTETKSCVKVADSKLFIYTNTVDLS